MLLRALLFFVAIAYATCLASQDYHFSYSNGTYTDLVDPFSLNNGEVWDDPQFTIPIGFTFTYFGQEITTLYIEDFFYGGILTSSNAEVGVAPLIIAYGPDLIDRGYMAGSSESEVSYQLSGQAGERILKVEWKNAGFYDDVDAHGVSTDFVNIQLWLYEGSNDIEIHFGPNSISFPNISFIGESGPSVGLVPGFDFDNFIFTDGAVYLVGDASDPDYVTTPNSEELFLTGTPPDGMIYKFSTELPSRTQEAPETVSGIYPNPVQDVLHIDWPGHFAGKKQARIYDQMGRVVYAGVLTADRLSVAFLSPGLYALRVETGQAVVFVKQ